MYYGIGILRYVFGYANRINVCMVMTHSMHACERGIVNKKCRRHMDKDCIKLLTRDESEF